MQCKEWDDANSELFKESHDEAVHKNSYKSRLYELISASLGEEGHEVAKGVQANWIHRGAPRPANPVRRHPAKSVCTRVRMIMILDVDVTAERRHYNTHRPAGDTTTLGPKGRCPLSESEHNPPTAGGHNPRAKGPSTLTPKVCPRLRSKNDTGRRLAVRIAMGCQIGALPCTPFASSRRSPQGETRSKERKNRESYISCTIPQFPPLEASAASQSAECLSYHMIQKANPVTLTSYSSPPKGETTHYILRVASAPSKCVRCAPKGDTITL